MNTPAAREIRGALTAKIPRAPSVKSYRFVFSEPLTFLPGQYGQVLLDPDRRENRDLNKPLSFSSSPTRDYVEVTKKLSDSGFSRALDALEVGDEALFRAPMGTCVFRDDTRKVGFLIGGIGITPVISIIEYIVERELSTDVVLFYSNRSEEEIAYRDELESWSAVHAKIRSWFFVTRVEPKDEKFIFGRMDRESLLRRVKDPGERLFYLFGPPRMVETMAGLCREIGCSEKGVKMESFAGY